MTWVKVDDRLSTHRKYVALGKHRHEAIGVNVDALCFASQELTDGWLPKELVENFPPKIVELLVRVGLWDHDPERGYRIHDYLVYNPSREQVQSRRAMRADAGRIGGMAHSQPPTGDLWADWGPEWGGFRKAWTERGFVLPPTPKQREMLWPVIDSRPTDAAKWVRSAPPDARMFEVIGHVMKQWQKFREAAT